MHNFPKMDKKFTNTKKHPYFILSALLIILIVITIYIFIFQKPKGGNDTGMFEKNSNSISIYYEDKMILTVTGEDQKQFVSYLKEIDLMNYTETKKDDTYQYKIDNISYLLLQKTADRLEIDGMPEAFGECLEHQNAAGHKMIGENLVSKPDFQYRWSGKSSRFPA